MWSSRADLDGEASTSPLFPMNKPSPKRFHDQLMDAPSQTAAGERGKSQYQILMEKERAANESPQVDLVDEDQLWLVERDSEEQERLMRKKDKNG